MNVRGLGRRLCACLVGIGLAGSPTVARAAPDDTVAPENETPEQAWARAERLFRQGSARFSAAQYQQAIENFTVALEIVSEHDFDEKVTLALLLNLARAHVRAYEVDRDIQHLRMATEIYRRLQGRAAEGTEEHEEATKMIPELEAQAAEVEEADEGEPAPAPAPTPAPATGPKPTPGDDGPGQHRGLIIGGGVLLGVGVAGLGLMGAGLALGGQAESDGQKLVDEDPTRPREDLNDVEQRGKTANALAIVGGALGGAALVTGAVLMGLGMKKRGAGKSALRPAVGPGFAGILWEGRF